MSTCESFGGTGIEPLLERNSTKAEAGKQDGMAKVASGANPMWSALALLGLKKAAQTQPYVFSDDVRIWMFKNCPNVTTRDNRAMGPVFTRAASKCWIKKVGMKPSQIPSTRKSIRHDWESLIYVDFPD